MTDMYFTDTPELRKFEREMRQKPNFDRRNDDCDENEMEGFVDHIVGFYIYAYKASVEYCTDVYLLLSSAANYFEYIHNATKAKKAKEMASKFLDDVHYYRACDEDFIKEFNKLVYM